VKSSPVYFYVQIYSSAFNQSNVPITFDTERLNVGAAMNLQTGKFTAPKMGKYFFSASGLGAILPLSTRFFGDIHIIMNGARIGYNSPDESGNTGEYETFSLQSTLNLKAGDQVWWQLGNKSPGFAIHPYGFNHFTGYLLEEEITDSLI
jgi:hypothetical protein